MGGRHTMSETDPGQVRPLSRRTLLTAAAAGLLAACTPNTPGESAAESGPAPRHTAPTPTPSPRVSKLSVAIIGAGGHGSKLARRLARDKRVRVAVVCDPDADRANALADHLERANRPRPTVRADLHQVLGDGTIDAVVVATPHHWHALAAIWAMQAGKHVYLEKPATHALLEGPALLGQWRGSGLVVEVGTQRRSHPGLQEAIAALQSGAIGDVQHARCYSWKRRPPIGPRVHGSWPASLDASLWFGPREIKRPTRQRFHYDWHWFPDYGNGGLGNNGVHRLDVARWGLRLPSHGDSVVSLGARLGPPDAGLTPNTAFTITSFGERSVAHDLRGLPTSPDRELDRPVIPGDEVAFVGDGASIVVNRTGGRLVDEDGHVADRFGQDAQDVDPIARHLRGFVAACLAGDPAAVAVGLEEGVAAADMCHAPAAAHASVSSPVKVDVERVRDDAKRASGRGIDAAVVSFLAHVRDAGGMADMAYTGIRQWTGDGVAGAAESFEYRRGFELSSSAWAGATRQS